MIQKTAYTEFAIFGETPAFEESLHVGRPNIGNRLAFEKRSSDILDRRWLTNGGRYVQEFEQQIAKLVGVRHCVVMCNATVALEIVIRALGLTGEVIVPSFTFIATAHALQWQEITPIFCDIDPLTHNLDPAKVEERITPRTSGIIGVHVWGRSCNIDALSEIAQRKNIKLMFDAAHALGASHKGKMIGGFGQAEVFSFHATKFLNSLEGGAVVTNDDELAHKMRMMKNFGFTGFDQTGYIGINGKMNEFSAAMGLTNLESLQDFIDNNYRNYRHYQKLLSEIPGISMVTYDETEKNNYQYIVLEIDETQTGLTRDQLHDILRAENIIARRYFYPGCHQMEPYRSYFPYSSLLLPETEKLSHRVLCLPTGTAIGEEEIDIICRIIRLAVENGAAVKEKISLKGL